MSGSHHTAGAPLNDAASGLANLVHTAVPSITKAFAAVSASLPSMGERKGATKSGETGAADGNFKSVRCDFTQGAKDDEKPDAYMGVLSKWINIGRGWQPRLFVLEGGVLSYYKLDGPDKASVRVEAAKYRSPLLVGEDTKRAIQREKEKEAEKGSHGRSASFGLPSQKPLGTIHLLVANTRASKSDDKKFYVYSGTKTLEMKAETTQERDFWMGVLESMKEKVGTSMKELGEMEESREAALATVREDAVVRLMQQLRQSGMGEPAMADFECCLRKDVLGELERKLKEEQHRRWQLQGRIKELETEKAQLETAVVEETKSTQPFRRVEGDEDSSVTEWEQESVAGGGHYGDEDDDGGSDNFFEALSEFVGSTHLDSTTSQRMSVDMEQVGFNFPPVERRTRLPEPAEEEKPVSLWSILKDFAGKDVAKLTLPVYFNEPISTLQKCAEELEYSWLLDRAAAYGKQGDQLMRALHVAAFALSGYACTEGRVQKPFNPILGETYEAVYPDKGFRFVSEKMQHNPNVVACHCEGQGWRYWGDCNMRIRFWGPSMQLDPMGVLSVEFEDGEVYQWNKVTTMIYNIILGKLYIDHYGTMDVRSNRNGMHVTLKFKERSIFDRNVHQVQGFAEDEGGKKLATLIGRWSERLHFVLGDPSALKLNLGDERSVLAEAQLLWKANARSENCGKYKFTPYCITLNEITPGLKEYLPPTDSRLRPDQRLLEEGRFEASNEEKLRLEQRQRDARKTGEPGWQPKFFKQMGPNNTWTYMGNYWDKREAQDWSTVKDLFAPLPPEVPPTSGTGAPEVAAPTQ